MFSSLISNTIQAKLQLLHPLLIKDSDDLPNIGRITIIVFNHFSKYHHSIKQGYALKKWVTGLSDEAYYPCTVQWAEIMGQEDIDYFPEFFGKIETKNPF